MPARLVMQNAAEKAGIAAANLVIALEPEAAVLACLDQETELVCASSFTLYPKLTHALFSFFLFSFFFLGIPETQCLDSRQ